MDGIRGKKQESKQQGMDEIRGKETGGQRERRQ